MNRDKRKARRRQLNYVAWTSTESGERQSCRLSDMSDTGARIEVENARQVPERFILLLSANGAARRTCRVVWRKPHQIGVSFELAAVAAEHATLVPDSAGQAETPAAAPVEAAASQ